MDTNVVSKFLAANLSEKGIRFVSKVFDQRPNISFITQIELLCWDVDKEIHLKLQSFVSDSNVLGISDLIISKCIEIRTKYKKIKLPDALIAATAIVNQYILLTTDEVDFIGIKNLKIKNPNIDVSLPK